MIYYESDLAPVIESIYLEEPLDSRLGSCNILVNPRNINYIFGKTIIINDPDYELVWALRLIEQGCKVISRIQVGVEGIDFQPYIMRVNFNIMWNGEVIDLGNEKVHMKEVLSLLSSDNDQKFKYDIEKRCLYFPKISLKTGCKDHFGNLTALGWALHQVGENQGNFGKFENLDLVKTKKCF